MRSLPQPCLIFQQFLLKKVAMRAAGDTTARLFF
jgi:hypothetical protein